MNIAQPGIISQSTASLNTIQNDQVAIQVYCKQCTVISIAVFYTWTVEFNEGEKKN